MYSHYKTYNHCTKFQKNYEQIYVNSNGKSYFIHFGQIYDNYYTVRNIYKFNKYIQN